LHIFKLRSGSTDLSAALRHWTNLSRYSVWQSRRCASACQKTPKPNEIRIAPVIFLLMDLSPSEKALASRFHQIAETRVWRGRHLRFGYRLEMARIAGGN
jgi:hypothetical protein